MSKMDVREIVSTELNAMRVDKTTLSLWNDIATTYEQSGPDGVKALLTERVKAVRKSATKEAKEMTAVAGLVSKPKKKRR
jgi:hypothetical protein